VGLPPSPTADWFIRSSHWTSPLLSLTHALLPNHEWTRPLLLIGYQCCAALTDPLPLVMKSNSVQTEYSAWLKQIYAFFMLQVVHPKIILIIPTLNPIIITLWFSLQHPIR